jgi:LEA14-like dessication related protein
MNRAFVPTRARAWIVTTFLMAGPAVLGCASKPAATLAGARITELTTDHVGVTFDVRVDNPWLVPIPLVSATGDLSSSQIGSGAPFLQLSGGSLGSVPGQGSLTVPLTGRLAYLQFLANLPNFHPGDEVPYEARLKLTAGVPSTNQAVDLPEIRHAGKIPLLALPHVSLKSVSWPTLSLDRVAGNLTLRIENTNAFSIGPGTTNGRVLLKKQASMSGEQELAGFSAQLENAVPGKGEGEIVVGISFDPRTFFSLSAWTSLMQALSSPSNLRVAGTFSGSTAYIPVTLDFDTH